MPELARCFALMPNLQTVQILDIWWWEQCYEMYKNGRCCKPIFEKAFDGYVFPSVRNIILPSAAISLLKCFPEVRMVYLKDTPKPEIHAEFVQSVAEHCPLVEQFDWAVGLYTMTPMDNRTMSFYTSGQRHAAAFLDVIRHLPNLRRIQLYTMYHDFVSWLSINGHQHSMRTICSGNAQGSPGNEIARSHHFVDPPESPMQKIQCACEQDNSPCQRNTRRFLHGQLKNFPCQVQIRDAYSEF